MLRPSACTQFRWTRNERTDVPRGGIRSTEDAECVRTRVDFEGDVARMFAHDVQSNMDRSGELALLDANLTWNVNDRWSATAGQFLTPTMQVYGRYEPVAPGASPDDL